MMSVFTAEGCILKKKIFQFVSTATQHSRAATDGTYHWWPPGRNIWHPCLDLMPVSPALVSPLSADNCNQNIKKTWCWSQSLQRNREHFFSCLKEDDYIPAVQHRSDLLKRLGHVEAYVGYLVIRHLQNYREHVFGGNVLSTHLRQSLQQSYTHRHELCSQTFIRITGTFL